MPIPAIPPSVSVATLPNKVSRGIGQSMTAIIQGYNSGLGISQTLHTRHWSTERFRKFQACIPTFATVSPNGASTVADTLHPCALNFQVAYETTFQASLTGLAERPLLTFSGSQVATFCLVTGVTITQGSNTGTIAQVLGTYANGQVLWVGTTAVGVIESISGTTLTLTQNYTGTSLSNAQCHTNNGSTQNPAYILSDMFDSGVYYTPGTIASPNFYGLYTTVECANYTVITGGVFTTGTNTLTFTSVNGPFGIGSSVFGSISGNYVLLGTVASGAGTSWVLNSSTTSSIASSTMYCHGVPYQRSSSSWLNRQIGVSGPATQATGTISTTSGSNVVTISGGAVWAKGFTMTAAGIPTGSYITNLGTYTGGAGTVYLSQNATATASGVTAVGEVSNISLDIARSQATFSAASSSEAGANNYFTPCMLVIQTNSARPFILCMGDSISEGADEGIAGCAFNGTIASNVLTVNSGFSGMAIQPGEQIYLANNTLACTIVSNISGSGNGSTWNVTTAAGGTAVQMYGSFSGLQGDGGGSLLGDCGPIERGVNESLGYSLVNISKGGDADYYITLNNFAGSQFRLNLIQAANPTHVILSNVHNDISHFAASAATTTLAANTLYSSVIGSVYNVGSYDYLCIGTTNGTTSGYSGSATGFGTTQGATIVDGQLVWTYLYPHYAPSSNPASTKVLACQWLISQKMKQIVPGANLIRMLPTIDCSVSTDIWATAANMTPTPGGWVGTQSTGNVTQSSVGTSTVTIASGTNWAAGQSFYASGTGVIVPAGTYVLALGTYASGAGTLILSNNVTIPSSVACSGWQSMRMQIYSMLSSTYVQAMLQLQPSVPLIDMNTNLEYGGSGQSQKWNGTGIAYGITFEGTHPTSSGNYQGGLTIPALAFPSVN